MEPPEYTDDAPPPPYELLPSQPIQVTPPGVIHYVVKGETLYGIAIAYGVNVSCVRLANKLLSDDIYCRSHLFIPIATVSRRPFPDANEIQKSLVKKFQLICKCDDVDEARSYVARNEWDVSKALEEYCVGSGRGLLEDVFLFLSNRIVNI
ncbi:hypothetical protein SeLEV6574_g07368 [Synchytrium endobioticum]|uniref:LysM domain-containing protein n=1 Tax=Synchytrium endobioticum TaxID=286115 RepID=A0A507CI84_9FUNG|nr:hypothetical protein SeLEV6574_g07368 [Synchytrium endobioticum]